MTSATTTRAHAADPGVPARARRLPFQKIAGIAGLLAIAVGMTQMVFVGDTPGLGASATEVAGYFAANGTAHRIGVVLPALLGIPIALYMVGVHRTLAAADRTLQTSWSTLFLYGALMMSATAGAAEGAFAVLALREGAGLAPETLRALNDGSQIASATLGVWIAVAVGSVAAATFQHHLRPAWYGWLCILAAALGVLSVVDTVSTSSGGIFADLGFFGGVIVWVTASSILMLRDKE